MNKMQYLPYSEQKFKEEHRLTYGDLDLKFIREAADIDFAHYTYKDGQCSCCYGPEDLPAKYWKDGVIKTSNYSYILFKNANNGSGTVKKSDYLAYQDHICISWNLSVKQLDKVVRLLRQQVGREFIVHKPEDEYTCIILDRRKSLKGDV